tara:strand:+ start:15720 stop:16727 length:1008 start_codon:yes stop_codon:yes gene_type:complete
MILLLNIIDHLIDKKTYEKKQHYKSIFFDAVRFHNPIFFYYLHVGCYNKPDIENIYITAKKTINSFKLFAKIWRMKRMKQYTNTTNILMDKNLSDIVASKKITLIHYNTIYTFSLIDLITLWNTALRNTEGLFTKPLRMKNPYTNIEFRKHNLYNIYFKLLYSNYNIPIIIQLFFKYNFNKENFVARCFPYLREYAIDNFNNTAGILDKFDYLVNMNMDYKRSMAGMEINNTLISYDIKKIYVNNFRQHIYHYIKLKYSFNPIIRNKHKDFLTEKFIDIIQTIENITNDIKKATDNVETPVSIFLPNNELSRSPLPSPSNRLEEFRLPNYRSHHK